MPSVSDDLVDGIYEAIYLTTIHGVRSLLERPPGRSPRPELVALSRWFNELDELSRQRVQEVITLSVDQTVFGLLAAVDGERTVISGSQLHLAIDEQQIDPEDGLHELFRAKVDENKG